MLMQEVVRPAVARTPLVAGYLDRKRRIVSLLAFPDPAGGGDYWLSRGDWVLDEPPSGIRLPVDLPRGVEPVLVVRSEKGSLGAVMAEGRGMPGHVRRCVERKLRKDGWEVDTLPGGFVRGLRDGAEVWASVGSDGPTVQMICVYR